MDLPNDAQSGHFPDNTNNLQIVLDVDPNGRVSIGANVQHLAPELVIAYLQAALYNVTRQYVQQSSAPAPPSPARNASGTTWAEDVANALIPGNPPNGE